MLVDCARRVSRDHTGVCEANSPPENSTFEKEACKASDQRLQSHFCRWIAGQRHAQKECFFSQTPVAWYTPIQERWYTQHERRQHHDDGYHNSNDISHDIRRHVYTHACTRVYACMRVCVYACIGIGANLYMGVCADLCIWQYIYI